jgi:hypothetical protein
MRATHSRIYRLVWVRGLNQVKDQVRNNVQDQVWKRVPSHVYSQIYNHVLEKLDMNK